MGGVVAEPRAGGNKGRVVVVGKVVDQAGGEEGNSVRAYVVI